MAKASSFSAARGSLLLFVLLFLQAAQVVSSPAPLAKRVYGQFPSFKSDFEGRVLKGAYLLSLLPLTDEEATLRNDGREVASPFTETTDVERWGWLRSALLWGPWGREQFTSIGGADSDDDSGGESSDDENYVPPGPGFGYGLVDAFNDPDYLVVDKWSCLVLWQHENKFTLGDGETIADPSQATYQNVLNPTNGAIIFDENFSPRWEIALNDLETTPPELENVSDIIFFQWLEACRKGRGDPTRVNQIVRAHITDESTYKIVQKILEDLGYTSVPTYGKRAIFAPDSREGQAILGTVHGSGAAMFLIQHKQQLGIKTITEVAVWDSHERDKFTGGALANLNLRFKVEEVTS